MKLAFVTSKKEESRQVKEQLIQALQGIDVEFDQVQPDICISIGGDGTLLRAFHNYDDQLDQVKFLGIHTGHLGFYTDWRAQELDELIPALIESSGETVSYPLLEVTLHRDSGEKKKMLALNEATIRRYAGTMTGEIYIQDSPFELFKGDGICVSTPTGSTGLNKSLGGAVVHPGLDTLQMTEIASINNRVYRSLASPLLIASDEWIRVHIDNQYLEGVFMTLDQLSFDLAGVTDVYFRIAKEQIHFLRYRHMHFWDRVEEAFIGHEEGRE